MAAKRKRAAATITRRHGSAMAGWVGAEALQALARGDESVASIAKRLGVIPSTVTAFRRQYQAEIDRMREDLANEFTDMWIASKRNRLAEYQRDVEQINELLDVAEGIKAEFTFAETEDGDGDPTELKIIDSGTAGLIRTKARVLRHVAEEMGQLPVRTAVTVTTPVTVQYNVANVDLGALT